MKKFLLPIILAVSALLGGAAGFGAKLMLTPKADEPQHAEDASAKEGDHGKKDAHAKKKGGHGEPADAPAFLKFSRQFVVPLGSARGRALMILDINIELSPDVGEGAYALEPKLRDACLSALLKLAAGGELAPIARSPEALESARAALLEAARSVLGEGAVGVLITDIAVQEG